MNGENSATTQLQYIFVPKIEKDSPHRQDGRRPADEPVVTFHPGDAGVVVNRDGSTCQKVELVNQDVDAIGFE